MPTFNMGEPPFPYFGCKAIHALSRQLRIGLNSDHAIALTEVVGAVGSRCASQYRKSRCRPFSTWYSSGEAKSIRSPTACRGRCSSVTRCSCDTSRRNRLGPLLALVCCARAAAAFRPVHRSAKSLPTCRDTPQVASSRAEGSIMGSTRPSNVNLARRLLLISVVGAFVSVFVPVVTVTPAGQVTILMGQKCRSR